MRNGFIGLAILGTVAVGTPGVAVAQGCPPGQIMQAGICQPTTTLPGAAAAAPAAPAPAATTTAAAPAPAAPAPAGTAPASTTTVSAPAATGTATAAPAAVSGSTTAPAPVAGPTAGAEAQKEETCAAGLMLYNHGCYPAQHAAGAMMR